MKNPFLIHVFVALVWIFLSGNTTISNLILALVLTFVLLGVFRKPLHCEDYIRRTVAFVRFIVRLLTDIVFSNLRVMRIAMRKDAPQVQGAFLAYPVEGLTDFEVLLVSLCVGLSPGTITVDRERKDDQPMLVLHVFPGTDPQEVRLRTDRVLKNGILSFTR